MRTLHERMTEAGARFESAGDALAIEAPRPLPQDLVVDLRACREDLLTMYRERASIRECDGGASRGEAEALAAGDVTAWLAEAGQGQAERMVTIVTKPAAEDPRVMFRDLEGEMGLTMGGPRYD